MDIYETLRHLNISISPGPKPLGRYLTAVRPDGSLLFTSGTGCRKDESPLFTGKVGETVTVEEAQLCAQQCVINILCNLQAELGDLNQIDRVVKLLGFVASADDFFGQSAVLNGASELLYEIFGDHGVGARSAIGVRCLPGNIPVEIEAVFQLKT